MANYSSKLTAIAYPHHTFDEICEVNNWNDNNVEELKDKAFISITCTHDVSAHYLEEVDEHWFKRNHPNVLNVEFDDVSRNITWGEYQAHVINEEQAEEIVNFIISNLGKNFYIHCRAGVSRSGAVEHFIHTNFYTDSEESGHIRPNMEVVRKLNNVLWKKKLINKELEN